MKTNLKPNSCLAKAGTLFFDYLVIFAGAVLYGISVAMFTSPNNVAPGGLTGVATMLNYMFSLPIRFSSGDLSRTERAFLQEPLLQRHLFRL